MAKANNEQIQKLLAVAEVLGIDDPHFRMVIVYTADGNEGEIIFKASCPEEAVDMLSQALECSKIQLLERN